MSKHFGDFDPSAVIYGKFSTFQPSTGATFTLAGSPAIAVYKDASTTESTSGVTLTPTFDSVPGLNHFAIDTSSDGTFYSAGSFFEAVLTAGTVDSVAIAGATVGSFTLRKDSSLKPATAGRTLVVDASGLGDANTVKLGPSGSGTAQTARDIGANVLLSPGTGTGQLSITSGVVDANTTKVSGTAQTARDLGASVLLSSGTGTGQLSFTSGVVKADPWGIALPGAYSSGTAGNILGNLSGSGDPWATALPGSYSAGQAGYILGNRIHIASNTVTDVGLNNFEFAMVDSSGVPRTGLSVTPQRSIDGASFGACSNSVAEVGSGVYKINLSAGDLNGAVITLRFTATGAQDRLITVLMVP
jgi:hypothetical protein